MPLQNLQSYSTQVSAKILHSYQTERIHISASLERRARVSIDDFISHLKLSSSYMVNCCIGRHAYDIVMGVSLSTAMPVEQRVWFIVGMLW